MIAATYIERNVRSLALGFRKSKTTLMELLFAKMVIVEIGGWVEMSMDDIVERAGRRLIDTKNIDHLKKNIINRTYAFDYNDNFRPMLMKTIGLISLEKLERRLNVAKHEKMKAALNLLKQARNSVAHTYVKHPGGTVIAAPSVAVSYFRDIYNGLKDIETEMRKLGLI